VVSSEERSLASGIFNSGASIGAILAPPLLALIVFSLGLRETFVAVGLLGFAWLAGWTILYRQPEATVNAEEVERVPLSALISSKYLWQFTLSKVVSDPVWYFYTFSFPENLKSRSRLFLIANRRSCLDPFLHSCNRECGRGSGF
jgi:MFS transporter, ACS family, hexuronate transporter